MKKKLIKQACKEWLEGKLSARKAMMNISIVVSIEKPDKEAIIQAMQSPTLFGLPINEMKQEDEVDISNIKLGKSLI